MDQPAAHRLLADRSVALFAEESWVKGIERRRDPSLHVVGTRAQVCA